MLVILFFVAIIVSAQAVLAAPPPQTQKTASFAANPTNNAKAQAIFKAAKSGKRSLAKFPPTPTASKKVDIFGDWVDLIRGNPIFQFIADMDVDCDGGDFKCSGNPDGQPQTSFGNLTASKVPFFVIPETFFQAQKSKIKPNSLGAIICGGKIFYGIFGDSNGDRPEVIGEASISLAQTCFPKDGLSGNKGHTALDVLYIHFGQQVPTGVGTKTINIPALKKLGDEQVAKLAQALRV